MERDNVQLIKQQLLADLPRLLHALPIAEKCKITKQYDGYRVGNNGSLSVRADGIWCCHESGDGGDVIDLIRFAMRMDFPNAIKFAKIHLGSSRCKVITFPHAPKGLKAAQCANRHRQQAKARWLWGQSQPVNSEKGGDHAGA